MKFKNIISYLAVAVIMCFVVSAAVYSGTITKGKLTKSDIALWTGTSSTEYERETSTGYSLILPYFDYMGVDVLEVYGGNVNANDTTLQLALDAIETTNERLIWMAPTTWSIDDNVTIPANVTTRIPPGCLLQIATTKTLTINGSFDAGLYRVFSEIGTGTVVFSDAAVKEVYPQWWTENTTPGTTDMASAVQDALDSVGSSGRVAITDLMGVGSAGWLGISVASTNDLTLIGMNKSAGFKVLSQPSQASGNSLEKAAFKFDECSDLSIQELDFDGNSIDSMILVLITVTDSIIKDNYLHDTPNTDTHGIYAESGRRNKFTGNTTYNCGRGFWIGNLDTADDQEINSIISGNVANTNQHTGIAGVYEECTISGNICIDNGGAGIKVGGDATEISNHVTITGNVCKGNVHGIQVAGISGSNVTDITVVGNTSLENSSSGIYVVFSEDVNISGNTCTDNNYGGVGSGRGIEVNRYAKRVNIVGNYCNDTRAGAAREQDEGIYVISYTAEPSEKISVVGNFTYNNLDKGIMVTNAVGTILDQVHVSGNTSFDNGGVGIAVIDAAATEVTNVSVVGNYALDNTTQDIRVDSTIFAQIENNFFSSSHNLDPVAFTAADATPSVKGRSLWKTDTGALTITMFNDGIENQEITVISKGAVVYDVTGTNLEGGTTDLTTAAGDSTVWRFDGTNWYLVFFMDMSDDLS